ncbi:MAG TPA: HAMP domain-containing sensor histidine kinase [Candidatus Binataceae bacterium]|nr:HAMP domain-containing sensor histidine kinase [Candidatus Binataceae bacterium]
MSSPYTDSALVAADFESFRRQESIFTILELALIVALLLATALFRPYFGEPSAPIVIALLTGFAIGAVQLAWLHARDVPPDPAMLPMLVWWSIGFNAALVATLLFLAGSEDNQYFVLMVVPVLEAAFRLPLWPALGVIALADALNFLAAYPLHSTNEYFEAGASSVIFTVVGVLVWLLVNNLREREARLRGNLEELARTRERLLAEEKLAAVGRLSSAIAHEIRNPVAMISSSLATAERPGLDAAERREMFAIAAREAERLARLTADFLAYARPRGPRLTRENVAAALAHVAAAAGAHAGQAGVVLGVEADPALEAEFDAMQMHQALLNLVLNAIDACNSGGRVTLSAAPANGAGAMRLEVADSAGPIPPETVAHLFEPFFTTKRGGTGLGLAIARNVARAHRGDLRLSRNEPGRVCFSIEIPAHGPAGVEGHDG